MHKQMKGQHVTRCQVLWRPKSWRIQGGECRARFAAFRKGQEKPVSQEPREWVSETGTCLRQDLSTQRGQQVQQHCQKCPDADFLMY